MIDTFGDVLTYGRAPLFRRSDHDRRPRIGRGARRRRLGSPHDAPARHLESRAIDLAVVDRVADVDVGVAVAVRGPYRVPT
jgi:hypothetical protein